MAIGGAIAGYLPYTTIVRPDALPAAGLLARIYAPVTDLALASLGLMLLLTPTGSAPSPGWRRWALASSAAMAAPAVAATVAPGSVDARVLSMEGPVGPNAFGGAPAVFNQLALAAALTGVAILRYRLYDLDRIVSRTLAYGLLTVLLGGGYVLVVLGLGQLMGRDSSLIVAAATLAVAAVFQPARRRIQQAVDRRFNRRRHDAARIIEGFGDRVREEVDLGSLTAEVLGVAEQTMQPANPGVAVAAATARVGRRLSRLSGGGGSGGVRRTGRPSPLP
jgi:hypothetical protein